MSSTSDRPAVAIEAAGRDVTVIRLTVPSLQAADHVFATFKEVYEFVERAQARRLVLNFREVKRLNSAMLAFLLGLDRKVQAAGGRLAVCHLAPEAVQLFRSFPRPVIHVYESEPEALASFSG